jgi:SAM-dependent methyltransferase
MKFSELVEFRQRLRDAYTTEPVRNELISLDNAIKAISATSKPDPTNDQLQRVIGHLQTVKNAVEENGDNFAALMAELDYRISQEGQKFFGENYKLELKYDAVENIRKIRILPLSDEIHAELLSRIQLYTSWQYPALEIGCRDGELTRHMVSADPLYIVDHYREFTDSAVKDFTEEYKRRIRVYLTPDSDLSILPRNQFAFILCWNFLNYRSLDTFKEYLSQAYDLLRPGGTFLFSYNDGDRPAGAGYAENFFMTYIPKSLLIPLCESMGFDVISDQAREMAISWLEVRKPGQLNTIRAHQTMGEIVRYTL